MAYNLPMVAPRKTGLERFSAGISEGAQLGNALQQMAQRRRQQELAERMAPLQEQQLEAQVNALRQNPGLKKLQLEQAEARLAQGEKRLDIYGRVHSPEAIAAKLEHDKELARTQEARSLSGTGKNIREQQNVKQGLTPGGQAIEPGTVSEEDQKRRVRTYGLERTKKESDPKIRNRLLQSNAISEVLETTPFDSFTRFYGIDGQLLAGKEAINVGLGREPSKDYQAYQNFLNVEGPSLVGMMRNFLSDSSSEHAQEALKSIVFPKKWSNNPITAKAQFEALVNVYNKEKGALQSQFSDPNIYGGQPAAQEAAPQAPVGQQVQMPSFNSREEGMAWYAEQSPEIQAQVRQGMGGQ